MRIHVGKRAQSAIKRLPPDRAKAAVESMKKFMETPSLPSLDFRTVKGLDDHFIINAKHGDRLILKKVEEDLYELVDVGPHDNVYARLRRR